MARCAAIKPNGERCKVEAIADVQWCWSHHPDYEQARQRRASKGGKRGGRGRPQADLSDLKRRILEVVDAVLEGGQDRGRAAVAIQGFNALRGVLDLELKVREQQE